MANRVFEIGQQVKWTRVAMDSAKLNAIGTIVSITAAPQQFAMYEVAFAFGRVMLYGAQLEPYEEARKSPEPGSSGESDAFGMTGR